MTAQTRLNNEQGVLEVIADNGELHVYPYVWLRDNCQCPNCYFAEVIQKKNLLDDLDLDVKPSNVKDLDGGNVSVSWEDGHESVYAAEWLLERSFADKARKTREKIYKRPANLWSADFIQNLPRADYQKCLTDDAALYNWTRDLEINGVVLVTNVPVEQGQIRRFSERFAFMKGTAYGDIFSVKIKKEPSDVGYTGQKLNLHSDGPWYHATPEVMFLHCIEQFAGTGGDSIISDAFYSANILRQKHPEAFKILTEVPVEFVDIGGDEMSRDKDFPTFSMSYQAPTITVNHAGELQQIRFGSRHRGSFLNVSLDKVNPFYKALKLFNDLLYQNSIHFKLQPGEMICIDNMRVLHGREGFDTSQGGQRHLEGGYVEWDFVRSLSRVLQAKLNVEY